MKKHFFKPLIGLLTFMLPFGVSSFAQVEQSTQIAHPQIIFNGDENLKIEAPIYRDPCQVFIGVSTVSEIEGGVNIVQIVDDSPAAIMDLKKGDVILALDGQEISNPCDLTMERDQNQPGDYFRLTILRNGKKRKVRGQFTPCEQAKTEELQTPVVINTAELSYKNFEVFPNPTFGEVNIAFEGEAVPTTILVADVTGKIVFKESMKQFDGFYRNQIDIRNSAAPGAVSLSIIQNGQSVSKNIVLMNRN